MGRYGWESTGALLQVDKSRTQAVGSRVVTIPACAAGHHTRHSNGVKGASSWDGWVTLGAGRDYLFVANSLMRTSKKKCSCTLHLEHSSKPRTESTPMKLVTPRNDASETRCF